MVPPGEGNEAGGDGRRGVGVSHVAEAGCGWRIRSEASVEEPDRQSPDPGPTLVYPTGTTCPLRD